MFDFVNFIKREPSRPSGNLIAFAYVGSYNPISEGSQIIACNVVVSRASGIDNYFPVIAFPPFAIENEDELLRLLELNPDSDITQLVDFSPPDDEKKLRMYLRKRIKDFDAVVGAYVKMCRDYFETSLEELRKKKQSLSLPWKNNATKNNVIESEEVSCIDQLEQYIKAYESVSNKEHVYFHKIIKMMEDKYPRYDVSNFAHAIGLGINKKETPKKNNKKSLKLATLYLSKFRAIHEEKYEEAAKIQNSIRLLERGPKKQGR